MFLEPKLYGVQYSYLTIWTIEDGIKIIDASKYLSASTNRKGNKKEVWGKLQNFLRFGKDQKTKIAYQQGDYVVYDGFNPFSRVDYSWAKTLGPFNGKGSPDRYGRFLKVVDLWLKVGCKRKIHRPPAWKNYSNVPTLQGFADDYMGVDCNCFVGGYFEENYPATGWDSSADWNNNQFYKGPKRTSVSDIKPLDILVQYISKKKKHVALIDKVHSVSGSTANVSICQSSGSKGVWYGDSSIQISSDGTATTTGAYNLNFNKGVYGVIGANS